MAQRAQQSSEVLKFQIENLRRSNKQGKPYIPLESLSKLITEESIQKELAKSVVNAGFWQEITDIILDRAWRTFAVLVLIDQVQLAKHFQGRGFLNDSRLPLELWDLKEVEGYDPAWALNFYGIQWQVLAPCFFNAIISIRINQNIALPFLEEKRVGGGGFGDVYEVFIDQDNQYPSDVLPRNISGPPHSPRSYERNGKFWSKIVRKELQSIKDHAVELENLALLNLLKHPNIVELLGSYEYSGKFNLLFPLAEGGTLAGLLESDQPKPPFESVETLLIALAGLSSAVENVHNFSLDRLDLRRIGCHHDLRPSNILVCGDKLLLADFGLSQLRDTQRGSRSFFEYGVDDYLAPECQDLDNEFKPSEIGRSSDIWSFGCILAEVLTYLVDGPSEVAAFREKRAFEKNNYELYYFHHGCRPSPQVQSHLSRLEQTQSQICKFLVILIKSMLSLQEGDRPNAKEVTAILQFIAICEKSTSIDKKFDLVCDNGSSLDTSLFLWRYNGWKHGLCILGGDDITSFDHFLKIGPVSDFGSIISCLSEVQDSLTSMSTTKPHHRGAEFRRVAQVNDRLFRLLSMKQRERAKTQFHLAVLQSEHSSDMIEKLDGLGVLELDVEIRNLVSLRNMTEWAEQHTSSSIGGKNLNVSLVTPRKPFGNHEIGTFDESGTPQMALIEWREYKRGGGNKNTIEELFRRLENLTCLLSMDKSQDFCSLRCRGFFHDTHRLGFGMVFSLPPRVSPNQGDYRELQTMLQHTCENPSDQPALEDKLKLAQQLANAVLKFHSVGWLHKNLTSSNVAFFPEPKTPLPALVRKPYIIGFNYSRSNDPLAFTTGASGSIDGLYYHPGYRKEGARYRPEYDYYSLGIVLLEIAMWRCIKDMTMGWELPSAHEFQQQLLKRRVPNVAAFMGTAYQEAVKVCIAGDFGIDASASGDSDSNPKIYLRFQELVVSRLLSMALV